MCYVSNVVVVVVGVGVFRWTNNATDARARARTHFGRFKTRAERKTRVALWRRTLGENIWWTRVYRPPSLLVLLYRPSGENSVYSRVRVFLTIVFWDDVTTFVFFFFFRNDLEFWRWKHQQMYSLAFIHVLSQFVSHRISAIKYDFSIHDALRKQFVRYILNSLSILIYRSFLFYLFGYVIIC